MTKTIKLIQVAIGSDTSSGASQNNKFYNMVDQEDGNFKASWGRIGTTGQTKMFPISKWQPTYNEKIKKGYKDVTSLYVEDGVSVVGFSNISDSLVSSLIAKLQAFAKKEITTYYNISSELVTGRQCEEAQTFLNELVIFVGKLQKSDDVTAVNKILLGLYQVIPRKMNNVRNYLLDSLDEQKFNRMITQEQDLLDTMLGQVKQASVIKDNKDDKLTILDALGIEMKPCTVSDKDTIKAKLQNLADRYVNGYIAINKKTQKKFDKYIDSANNKKRELFWHGSRNENWMSLLESGLVLRPTNAVINGKMVGEGLYFADKAQKSLGYTSLHGSYWARGRDTIGYMALFSVHTGSQLHAKKHEPWMYSLNEENLKKRGDYDSIFFEGGVDLINSEYVIYNENQSSIQYLVELQSK